MVEPAHRQSLEQVEDAERRPPVRLAIPFPLRMQPPHTLLPITGDQRLLNRAGDPAFGAGGQ